METTLSVREIMTRRRNVVITIVLLIGMVTLYGMEPRSSVLIGLWMMGLLYMTGGWRVSVVFKPSELSWWERLAMNYAVAGAMVVFAALYWQLFVGDVTGRTVVVVTGGIGGVGIMLWLITHRQELISG